MNEEKIAADFEIEAEDRFLFYEWLVKDLKDEAFIKWIEIHQEWAKWYAPRHGNYDSFFRETDHTPMDLEKPSDACKLPLWRWPAGAEIYARPEWERAGKKWTTEVSNKFYAEANALTEQFIAAHKEILEHLEQVKVKFPYDLSEFDCKQKMEHLDELVKSVVRCPYPTYSGPVSEVLSTKSSQNEPTSYEKCIKKLNKEAALQAATDAEIKSLLRRRARTPDSLNVEK